MCFSSIKRFPWQVLALLLAASVLTACGFYPPSGSSGGVSGMLAFSAASYSVAQNGGTITITVNRSGGSKGSVSVAYATSDGTAVSGTDYTKASGTLLWSDGDGAAKSFSVPISNTTAFPGSRTLTVAITNVTGGATLGSPNVATITINGDGVATPGALVFSAATYTVSQSAGTLTVTVNRTNGSSGTATVAYATSNGTALAGTDYTAASGTLSWTDGDAAAKTFSISISNATSFSGTKTFTVALSNPTGATLGTPSSATVTINGGAVAAPGTLELSASNYSVSQSAGTVKVTVNRTNGSSGAATVAYATSNGTALAGTDYTAASGTLSWADGDAAAKTISIPISNATPFSGTKAFTIAISNPTGATLGTPSSATVTILGSATGNNGFSISVKGNTFVNGSGEVVQLRGADASGLEFVAIQGWDTTDPWGGGKPNWTAMTSWGINIVRFPLNEASWLGLTCADTSGKQENADPGGNYQATVTQSVAEANAAGIYVILDLHWAAPGSYCPETQTQMADNDHSPAFWTSIANTFKNNPAVIFELYNEPYFYGLTSGEDQWSVLLNGGTLTWFPATSSSGAYQQVNTNWQTAGMQQLLNAIRATGATNVILEGGVGWNDDLSEMATHLASDPLNQFAVAWHPYPPAQSVGTATVSASGSGYAVGDTITLVQPDTVYAPAVLKVTSVGSSGGVTGVSINSGGSYLQTNLPSGAVAQGSTSGSGTSATFVLSNFQNSSGTWSMPANWSTVQSIAAKVPVIFTETGEHNTPGTSGAPFLAQLLPWADTQGMSYLGWTWNVWQNPDDVLIKDSSGTPTDGYGVYFKAHLLCRAAGTSSCP